MTPYIPQRFPAHRYHRDGSYRHVEDEAAEAQAAKEGFTAESPAEFAEAEDAATAAEPAKAEDAELTPAQKAAATKAAKKKAEAEAK